MKELSISFTLAAREGHPLAVLAMGVVNSRDEVMMLLLVVLLPMLTSFEELQLEFGTNTGEAMFILFFALWFLKCC